MLIKGLSLQAKGIRRDRVVIFSDMLICAIGGTGKTELMYRVGLSTSQLHKYMEVLVRSELLEMFKQKKRIIYRTTAKGKSFLEAVGTMVKLLD
jgi:predicted transcriptional regulator